MAVDRWLNLRRFRWLPVIGEFTIPDGGFEVLAIWFRLLNTENDDRVHAGILRREIRAPSTRFEFLPGVFRDVGECERT